MPTPARRSPAASAPRRNPAGKLLWRWIGSVLACARYFEWTCCSSGLCRPPRPRVLHRDRAVIVMGGLVPLTPRAGATLSGVSVPLGTRRVPAPEPARSPPATVTPEVAPGAYACTRLVRVSATSTLPVAPTKTPSGKSSWLAAEPAPFPPAPFRCPGYSPLRSRPVGRPTVGQRRQGRANSSGGPRVRDREGFDVGPVLSSSDVRAEPRPTRRPVQCPKTPQSLTHLPK